MSKFILPLLFILIPATVYSAPSKEQFGKLSIIVSDKIKPKAWRHQCGLYVADVMTMLLGETEGTVSALPPTIEASVASMYALSGPVGGIFTEEILAQFSGTHSPVGTTIDALTSVKAKNLLLCYLSGECGLPDKSVYFPLLYKVGKKEIAPLYDFNGTIYVPEQRRIDTNSFPAQLIFLSKSEADSEMTPYSSVVNFFGEVAKFSAWVDLFDVAKTLQKQALPNDFFDPFLTRDGDKYEWDAGFVFVYSHLKSMLVRHILMAQHLDALYFGDSHEEAGRRLDDYRHGLKKEMLALFKMYGPLLEKALPHFKLVASPGKTVNFLEAAVRAERKVDQVILQIPPEKN